MVANASFETAEDGYGPELLTDGDMEAAGVVAWTAGASATITKSAVTPYEGTQCLNIAFGGVANPNASQAVLTVGKVFLAVGAARGDGTAVPKVYLGTTLVWTGTSSTDWQPYSVFGVCAGSTAIVFEASVAGAGSCDFDACFCKLGVSAVPIDALCEGWSISGNTVAGSFSPAAWGSVAYLIENFEANWQSNHDRIDGLSGHVTEALFDTVPETVEDFEEEWSSNEGRLEEFGTVAAASFDSGTPEEVEDFEEEWSSNEGRKTSFTGVGADLDDALFDSGVPESAEDFEEEWDSNENRKSAFVGVGSDLTQALWLNASSVAALTYEGFEIAQSMVIVLSASSAGAAYDVSPSATIEIEVKGTFSASLDIEVQRDGFSGWSKFDTGITTAGITNLDYGITAVRIYTDTYSSGTPQAYISYRDEATF